MYTKSEIAEALGLRTPSGYPHTLLVSFLLREVEVQPVYHQQSKTLVYTPSILPYLRYVYGKIVKYELPEEVSVGGRCFQVRYWPEEQE